MKILLLSVMLLTVSPLFAFEVVNTGRATFGEASSEQGENKQTVPGMRTFSNYAAQSIKNNWNKASEAKQLSSAPAAKTSRPQQQAQKQDKDVDAAFTPNIQLPGANDGQAAQAAGGKKAAASVTEKDKKQTGTNTKNAQNALVPSDQGQEAAAQMQQQQQMLAAQQDPAKLLQSVQGMMGGAGGGKGGMPDISALMGSLGGGGAAAAQTQLKK